MDEIARALGEVGGEPLKVLFRYSVLSLAAHFPSDWDEDATPQIKQDDRLVSELKGALGLLAKLKRTRGPSNGGLQVQNIIALHAKAAMQAAWSILSDLRLAAGDKNARDLWPDILKNARRLAFHGEAVFGQNNFALLIALEGWLADNASPRATLNPLGDRLIALREMLFPTDSAELGGEEAYDIYGLRELDLLDFSKLNSAGPAPQSPPTPPQVLPSPGASPPVRQAPVPELWLTNTVERMTRDEALSASGNDAGLFMSSI